jgi:hypothetical protein
MDRGVLRGSGISGGLGIDAYDGPHSITRLVLTGLPTSARQPDAASHLDRVCAAPTASPTTPTPSNTGDTNPPTSLSTSAPTYMPTRPPTFTDGIPYQRPRDLRAAHALPEPTWSVCAGATFAWGALGSSECPANYFRIVDEGACRSAAAAAGQAYDKRLANADYPQGCFMSESTALSESTAVYCNIMGTTSTRQSQSKLLCSGARVALTLVEGPSWVLTRVRVESL